MSSMNNTVLFLGATGGVTNACLTSLLTSTSSPSYKAIAMVRNPTKLHDQLQTLQNLSEEQISSKLTIVQGNATVVSDVKAALLTHITSGVESSLPGMIVTGIGGAPSLTFNFWRPWDFVTIDQPNICTDGAKALLGALREIYSERPNLVKATTAEKPNVAFVSTTGITRGPEDVPLSMRFLYHMILARPHEDKKEMERIFREEVGTKSKTDTLISTVTGIRPTLLMGTGALKEAVGLDKIRAGTEEAPELGFTVQRADVGNWIFENVIEQKGEKKWRGQMASLTA